MTLYCMKAPTTHCENTEAVWITTTKRKTYVPIDMELTDEEYAQMRQYPFRAAFYIVRDPLPRAIVVRR